MKFAVRLLLNPFNNRVEAFVVLPYKSTLIDLYNKGHKACLTGFATKKEAQAAARKALHTIYDPVPNQAQATADEQHAN